jgi:hypothetical protein
LEEKSGKQGGQDEKEDNEIEQSGGDFVYNAADIAP